MDVTSNEIGYSYHNKLKQSRTTYKIAMDSWIDCICVVVVLCMSVYVSGCHGEPVSAMVPLMAQSDNSPPTHQQQTPGE